MRAVQIALFVMSLQLGLGFVAAFGGFGNVPYESTITGVNVLGEQKEVTTTEEQSRLTFGIISRIRDILTWGWIKDFVMPWYHQSQGVKTLVDFICNALTALTGIIYGAALIELIANRVNVLGGG